MMRVTCLVLASWMLLGLQGVTAADVTFERVFGPEHPGGKYKHPASIEQLANGDLYVVFYGGSGEYEEDTAVWGARHRAEEAQWTTPQVIADTPGRSEGNAVVWQAPDGVVWLFYLTRATVTPGRPPASRPRSRPTGPTTGPIR